MRPPATALGQPLGAGRERVTNAPHRLDELRTLRVPFDLLAQTCDQIID
jgi:hypothetical protein